MDLKFQIQTKIQRPIAEVFDAVYLKACSQQSFRLAAQNQLYIEAAA